MFRTNQDSSKWTNRNGDRKPTTPLSDRKHENTGQHYINLNSTRNQLLEGSKNKELTHSRNHSDYQLTLNNSKTGNMKANKQNIGNQNPQNNPSHQVQQSSGGSKKNHENINIALIIQELSEKINRIDIRLLKNEETVKSINLRPLSAFDDFSHGENFPAVISNREKEEQIKDIKKMAKNIEELRTQQKKYREKVDLSLSHMKDCILEMKGELKGQQRSGTEKNPQWQVRMESLQFGMKDLYDRIRIDIAKSNQQSVDKFVDITKAQINNLRKDLQMQFRNYIDDSIKFLEGDKNLKHMTPNPNIHRSSDILYTNSLVPSNKIFAGRPICFLVQESLKVLFTPNNPNSDSAHSDHSLSGILNTLNKFDTIDSSSGKEFNDSLKLSESMLYDNLALYYIDCDGYLLDDKKRYLVDGQGTEVKLNEKEIKKLKEFKVMK